MTLFFLFFLFSHRRSARITKLILQKLRRVPKNLGVNTFQDPVGHFWPPRGHFGFWRRCSIAGGESVPPAPLGWYCSCKNVNSKSLCLYSSRHDYNLYSAKNKSKDSFEIRIKNFNPSSIEADKFQIARLPNYWKTPCNLYNKLINQSSEL